MLELEIIGIFGMNLFRRIEIATAKVPVVQALSQLKMVLPAIIGGRHPRASNQDGGQRIMTG
jgi:hypothetical protein